jgi:lysophospholipase L1-like esterase
MNTRFACVLLLVVGALPVGCSDVKKLFEEEPAPPVKVLIIGDSISMQGGYFPATVELLGDGFVVTHNPKNGGDSANVLANLDEWVTAANPDIIHINCGLHDLKLNRETGQHQQSAEAYRENLEAIATYLTTKTEAKIIFALTTPVNDAWHKSKPFDRRMDDVRERNRIATVVMQGHNIAVNDLYAVMIRAGRDKYLVKDGVHFNKEGSQLLAKAVAAAIKAAAEK